MYFDDDGVEQRQKAHAVCVAGNSLGLPWLPLMSESSSHPDGLGSSFSQVERNYMRHLTSSPP